MSQTNRIRVLLVDDHAVVRSGLGAFLMVYPDLELVGEAASGEEALAAVEHLKPEVVLMDLLMPGLGGIAAIRAIHQKHPEIRILALTSFPEEGLVQGALQAGATGYLIKNVSGLELANAIRSTYAGRMTLSPEAAQVLIQSTAQGVIPGEDLTERERAVLGLIVKGLSNAQIAKHLSISASTVKYHIGNIFSKLGASSRTEAASIAIQRRLVD